MAKNRNFYKGLLVRLFMEKKSVFLETFGTSPINRVLDFLIIHEEFDYSMTDIAKLSGVGYSTLKLFWKGLVERGIVVKTREVGKAKMFKLDLENPVVQKFKQFYWETTKLKTDEMLAEKSVSAKV